MHRNWLAILSVEGGEVGVPVRAPLLSVSQIGQEQNSATGRARVAEASGICSRDPSPREPRAHAPGWVCSEGWYMHVVSPQRHRHSRETEPMGHSESLCRPGLCGSPLSVPLLVTLPYQDEPVLLMCSSSQGSNPFLVISVPSKSAERLKCRTETITKTHKAWHKIIRQVEESCRP